MFRKLYLKYLQRLLLFTIIILALYMICAKFFPQILSTNCIYLIVFFLIVIAATHAIVIQTDAKRLTYEPDPTLSDEEQKKKLVDIEKKFISHYMIATTIKLFSFLLLLIVYAFTNKSDMLLFGLNFIILYIAYSLFEIFILKKPVTK